MVDSNDVFFKYKILTITQGMLGVCLFAMGVLGTVFITDNEANEEDYIDTYGDTGAPYFLGGYLAGAVLLISAICTGCVLHMGRHGLPSDMQQSGMGCCIYGNYILAMFNLLMCLVGVILAATLGVNYDESDYVGSDDEVNNTRHHRLSYGLIAGCVLALLVAIFSIYLTCTYAYLFGVAICQKDRAMVSMNMNNSSGHSSNFGVAQHSAFGVAQHSNFGVPQHSNFGVAQTSHFGVAQQPNNAQNSIEMEQLRMQNLILQQQVLQQQQQLQQQQLHQVNY